MMRLKVLAAAAAGLLLTASSAAWASGDLRLNQIQVIGTHNSYHAGLTPGMAMLLQRKKPSEFAELDYSHADLPTQLSHGIRQLELDVYADTAGGRFAHPSGPKLVAMFHLPADPPLDPAPLSKPGFKVMHLQDIDYVSNCQPFTACLTQIRDWSRAHPNHLPLFILVETKTQPPIPGVPMTTPEPFTPTVLDALDGEIRSVFPSDEIITPDQVRGRRDTLEQAILAGGWPTLKAARGRVVFLLDQANVAPAYLQRHPSLRGRVLFTNAIPGQPDAAFVEENDGTPDVIAALVRKGYLVRTRSDADTKEGRSNDVRRRDAALSSGAQIVSTDYPTFEPARWTGYSVGLPGGGGGAARCNPVNAPLNCSSSALHEDSGLR